MESRQIRSLITEELISAGIKDCCYYAFLSGAIRGAGELSFNMKGFSLEFRHLNAAFVNLLAKIINNLYKENLIVEELKLQSGYLSGDFFTLYVPIEISKDLLDKCGIVKDGCEILSDIPSSLIKNTCCKRSYLRGLYLACGYLKVPEGIDNFSLNSTKGGYQVSLKLNSALVKNSVKELIIKVAKISAKTVGERKNSNVLYLKNSDAICNFFTAIGSNKGVLEIYQIITERKMKNDVNRANNFDLANIDKRVAAGEKQIASIKRLEETVGLDNLPAELQKLAVLRLNNPDLGLVELGQISNPPVSKSCINHRLRKLMELSEKNNDEENQ